LKAGREVCGVLACVVCVRGGGRGDDAEAFMAQVSRQGEADRAAIRL